MYAINIGQSPIWSLLNVDGINAIANQLKPNITI